jgi:diguanylate cyclase (GGDEF)-like protein
MKTQGFTGPDTIELRGFNRTLAEIEWLLLVLVLVFLLLPDEPLEQPLAITIACAIFAIFVLGFRYLDLFALPPRWKLAIETWGMLAFTGYVVWHTGKVESPLIPLFLLTVIFSALTLGKLITLLEVGLIASFYLLAAYSVSGTELFTYATFSRLMLLFAPVVLVAYITSLIAADMNLARLSAQHLSETDELTGLPNMRVFSRALARHTESAIQDAEPLAVMMVDLDNLKQINDRYGHPVGNQAILAVAEAIRHSIRAADLVARYGGDEFILLLPGVSDQAAREAAERIRAMVSSTLIEAGAEIFTTSVSIGYAVYPDMAEDVETLTLHADAALYASKHAGRNEIHAFSDLARLSVAAAEPTRLPPTHESRPPRH